MEIVTYVAAALQSEVFAHGSLGDGRVGIADPAGVAHVVVNYNDINNNNNRLVLAGGRLLRCRREVPGGHDWIIIFFLLSDCET